MLNVNRLSKKLDEQYLKDAILHAQECFPNESAGVIIENRGYIPILNVSNNPAVEAISRSVENIYAEADKVVAVVHSHTNGFKHASLDDMQCQIASDLPFIVLCLNDNKECDFSFSWGGDNIPNLLGREYVSGVNDCYSIIEDFYMLSGVELPCVARGLDFLLSNDETYEEMFKSGGFELVNKDKLEIGDILLSQIKGKNLNHAAIYIGNDKILHHLANRLNCRDSLTRWGKLFTSYLRYTKENVDFSKSMEILNNE